MATIVVKDGCRRVNLVAPRPGVGNLKYSKTRSDPCSPEKNTVSYKIILTFNVSLNDKNK